MKSYCPTERTNRPETAATKAYSYWVKFVQRIGFKEYKEPFHAFLYGANFTCEFKSDFGPSLPD